MGWLCRFHEPQDPYWPCGEPVAAVLGFVFFVALLCGPELWRRWRGRGG